MILGGKIRGQRWSSEQCGRKSGGTAKKKTSFHDNPPNTGVEDMPSYYRGQADCGRLRGTAASGRFQPSPNGEPSAVSIRSALITCDWNG